MSRSKRGPALIELIHTRDASDVRLPSWWRSGSATREKESAGSDAVRPPAVDPIVSPGAADPPATPPPFAEVRGDRLVFALSSFSAGVVVFFFVVIVGGSFLAGREVGRQRGQVEGFRSGEQSVQAGALGEIEAARQSAPNPDIFTGLGPSPIEAADGKPASSTAGGEPTASTGDASGPWIKDYTYIVVQEFKAEDLAEAEAAQLFLRDHGIEAVILESGGAYRYRLVATKGFNGDDPAQREWCEQYHEKIKELGRRFVKAGGRYHLQGYRKKLTGPGW